MRLRDRIHDALEAHRSKLDKKKGGIFFWWCVVSIIVMIIKALR